MEKKKFKTKVGGSVTLPADKPKKKEVKKDATDNKA